MSILTFELEDEEHEERHLHSWFYEDYDYTEGDMYRALVDGLRQSPVEELRELATRAALRDEPEIAYILRELEDIAKSDVIDYYHSTTRVVLYEPE